MMKTRSMRNLENKKLQLKIKQLELEKQIRHDWKTLKEDLSPRNFIQNKLESIANKKTGDSLLFEVINHGLTHLGNTVFNRAEHKVEALIQKKIDNLTKKLNTSLNKK